MQALSGREKIQKVIPLLNRYDANWFNHIALDKLNMSCTRNCILGQLFGRGDNSYENGKAAMHDMGWPGINEYNDELNGDCHGYHAFEGFTAEWKLVILELRNPPIKSTGKTIVVIDGFPTLMNDEDVPKVIKTNATQADLDMFLLGMKYAQK